jgi:hypothetical protein
MLTLLESSFARFSDNWSTTPRSFVIISSLRPSTVFRSVANVGLNLADTEVIKNKRGISDEEEQIKEELESKIPRANVATPLKHQQKVESSAKLSPTLATERKTVEGRKEEMMTKLLGVVDQLSENLANEDSNNVSMNSEKEKVGADMKIGKFNRSDLEVDKKDSLNDMSSLTAEVIKRLHSEGEDSIKDISGKSGLIASKRTSYGLKENERKEIDNFFTTFAEFEEDTKSRKITQDPVKSSMQQMNKSSETSSKIETTEKDQAQSPTKNIKSNKK